MKTDSRIVISIDKQFYSDDDEIRIHLTVLSPAGRKIDSSGLKTDAQITETFAFTCGGPFMFENGYYTIKVDCENAVSEAMFEYYNSKNRFGSGFVK
jgi:hypothetical protein